MFKTSPGFQLKLKYAFWLSDEVSHKLYCGTYCYNIFSRSESGAETRSQTFQFLIDILNQNQVVEQVSTDI
jgi:hypothetical protein